MATSYSIQNGMVKASAQKNSRFEQKKSFSFHSLSRNNGAQMSSDGTKHTCMHRERNKNWNSRRIWLRSIGEIEYFLHKSSFERLFAEMFVSDVTMSMSRYHSIPFRVCAFARSLLDLSTKREFSIHSRKKSSVNKGWNRLGCMMSCFKRKALTPTFDIEKREKSWNGIKIQYIGFMIIMELHNAIIYIKFSLCSRFLFV